MIPIEGTMLKHTHPHTIYSVNDKTVVNDIIPTPAETGTLLTGIFTKKGTGNRVVELTGPDRLVKCKKMFGEPTAYDVHYQKLVSHLLAGGDAYVCRLVTPNQKESAVVTSMHMETVDPVEDLYLGYVYDKNKIFRTPIPTSKVGDPAYVPITIPIAEYKKLKVDYVNNAFDSNLNDVSNFLEGDGDVGKLVMDGNGTYGASDTKKPIAVSVYSGQGKYGENMTYSMSFLNNYIDNVHPMYKLTFMDSKEGKEMASYTGIVDKYTGSTLPHSLETKVEMDEEGEFSFTFAKPGMDHFKNLLLGFLNDIKNGWLNDHITSKVTNLDPNAVPEMSNRYAKEIFIAPLDNIIHQVELFGLGAVNLSGGPVTGIDWLDELISFKPFGSTEGVTAPIAFVNLDQTVIDTVADKVDPETNIYPFSDEHTPVELLTNFYGRSTNKEVAGYLENRLLTPVDYIMDPWGYGGYEDLLLAIKGLCETRMDVIAIYNAPTYIEEADEATDYVKFNTTNSTKMFRFINNYWSGLTEGAKPITGELYLLMLALYQTNDINSLVRSYVGVDKDTVRPIVFKLDDKDILWDYRGNYLTYIYRNQAMMIDGDLCDKPGVKTSLHEMQNQITLGKAIKALHRFLDRDRNKIQYSDSFTGLINSCNEILATYSPNMTFNAYFASEQDRGNNKVTDEIIWTNPVERDRYNKVVINIINSL